MVERAARLHLVRIRARLDGVWGSAAERALLGLVAGLVIVFGGVGAEFIYFQF